MTALPHNAFTSDSQTPREENPLAGIIDTIEAIIIALILALTFRAFVVEAFVIPTGSMAPTLLGAHFKATCPKCGYGFDTEADLRHQYFNDRGTRTINNTQNQELVSNRNLPCDNEDILCPNCGYHIDSTALPQYQGKLPVDKDMRGRHGTGSAEFAWANNGDRILVLKYLYAVLSPQRWDVIVFKEPSTAQNNYIKRLIALPGETIEIIDGDIYVAPQGKTGPADRRIARKPVHIQNALWQLVYDNDFLPTDAGSPRDDGHSWNNPWEGAGTTAENWNFSQSKITYNGSEPGTAQFVIRDNQTFYTYNVLGYNRDVTETAKDNPGGPRTRVGDLHLESTWTPQSASAESVSMVLGLPRNCYKITWNKKGVELSHRTADTQPFVPLAAKILPHKPPQAGRSYNLVFNNVDRSAQFFINGTLVVDHHPDWSALDAFAEKQAAYADPSHFLKPHVYIQVDGACTLGHLKLARDLYYTNVTVAGQPGTATEGNPLTLGVHEFFALGDNSRKSSDGRMWNTVFPALDDLGTRRGIVPERYLLGKAFFVYWPAGYRLSTYKNISALELPIVPDVGDMRLIR